MPMRRTLSPCSARSDDGQAAVAPRSNVMNSRRLVCFESSILKGGGGGFTTPPPSQLEARSRLGRQTANEPGAPVVSSTPGQLQGHEPASARMGYEDGKVFCMAVSMYRRTAWMYCCCLPGAVSPSQI